MIDEIKRRRDRADGGYAGRLATLDHDDLDAKLASRPYLRIGCRSAGILCDDSVDAVFTQHSPFVVEFERSAGQNVVAVRYGERRIDGIDAAHEIVMLRGRSEAAGLLPPDGEEDAPRDRTKCADRGVDVIDARPAVATFCLPFRAAERKNRNRRPFGGLGGVRRDHVGEWMGGIDEQRNVFFSQVINQSIDAAEAADAGRQRQRFGIDRAAGKRYGRVAIAALRQGFRQSARLGRAAEDENMRIAHG